MTVYQGDFNNGNFQIKRHACGLVFLTEVLSSLECYYFFVPLTTVLDPFVTSMATDSMARFSSCLTMNFPPNFVRALKHSKSNSAGEKSVCRGVTNETVTEIEPAIPACHATQGTCLSRLVALPWISKDTSLHHCSTNVRLYVWPYRIFLVTQTTNRVLGSSSSAKT